MATVILTFDSYTLVCDVENRMVSASGSRNPARYAFDARGRRKSRTVNGFTTISVTDADNREVWARPYSTGRFFQAEPIEYEDGITLYAHVDNDPLDRTDRMARSYKSLTK